MTLASLELKPHVELSSKIYTHKELEELRDNINRLNDTHHSFILKMICDNNIDFSENKNGCFINLLNVPHCVITKIEQYVIFLNDKEDNLKEFEDFKESIQHNII